MVERPLSPLPGGTVTFLFTDIEGSTRLLHELGDSYATVLTDQRRLLREAFDQHRGREVDTQGDSFFVAFGDAHDAVGAAAAAQKALAAHAWPQETEVRVRMGLHTGEPLIVGEHYVGIDVHRAARIAAAANGGQVLVSARTSALLQENGGVAKAALRELGAFPLKDLPEPERIFQLVVEGLPASFPPLRVDKEAPAAAGLPDYSLPPADVPCPYKGLVRFEAEDSELFFGREELVSELADRLERSPFLGVVGPSGSGKSSLVRAGVVPELVRRNVSQRPVVIEPGEHPVAQLARTQAADLVVVDQFEETFTLCRDEEERLVFVDRLLDAAEGRARVVLMLRADFYGHCASYGRLAAALEDGQALIGPMTEEELRRAIERPAEQAGLVLEPGLAEGILRDIVGEPGALPLLSHSLLETWRRRSDRMLTLLGYLQSGGVRGAIAKTAETVYHDALAPRQQTLARNIFMRLTELGEGTEDTRRRVRVGELTPRPEQAADVQEVLRVLVDARLVTTDESTVEVAHEALIRHWPTLRSWLDEDREGRLVHRRLTDAAHEWEALGRDPGALYRGTRLAAALDWAEQHDDELNELEREFLGSGRAAEVSEIEATRRRNRRLRVLVAALAVLLVGAVGAGAFALVQRSDAQTKARVALAGQLGAQAVSEPRIDRAMLLAREALALDDSPRTAGRLLATLLRSPSAIGTFSSAITDRPQFITLSPDGKTLSVVENTSLTRFVDTRTRRERHAPVPDTMHFEPAYSSNGNLLVLMRIRSPDPVLDLRDGHTLRHLRFLALSKRWLSTPTSFQNPFFVSPDERTAFMAYSTVDPDNQTDGPAYVDWWDVRSGKLLGSRALGSKGMFGGRISGGKLLLLTDTQLVTLDANTLRRLKASPVRLPANSFDDLAAISPDGTTIAVASLSGAVSFVDVRSGHVTVGSGKTGSAVQAVDFSPRGDVAVTTNESGQVTIWDPESGHVLSTFTGHEDRTMGIAFSADGSTLYTSSLDGAIFEWDLGGKRRFGHPFDIPRLAAIEKDRDVPLLPPLALSPDSSRFATRIGWNRIGIFSADMLQPLRSFTVAIGGPIVAIAWSPTGDELAVSSLQGRVQLWDVGARPRMVHSLQGIEPVTKQVETVNAVAFSPSGDLVGAVATNESPPPPGRPAVGLVGVWDTSTGKLLWRHVHRRGPANALAFAADGKHLALGFETGPDSGNVQIVDAKTGRIERTLRPIGFSQSLAFAPDSTLATGSWSGIVERWDVSSGTRLGHPILALPAPVASISFDPSGATFATGGGSGGFVKLWDTQTLQQVGSPFPGSPGQWANGQFTADGSKLVTLYQDGRGTVWPARVEDWEDHACRVAARNFTREEWSRYVTGREYSRVCRTYSAGP